jgi:predicted class III extradiol MEMO1 family dioxygenase
MELLKKIIAALLLAGMAAILYFAFKPNREVIGVILPHHLLVEKYIDEFYRELSSENDFENIILLSPNHFNTGFSYIQSSKDSLEEFGIDINKERFIGLNNDDFVREHGIKNQYMFIRKYFPNAKILPIIIKETTPRDRLDKFINILQDLNKEKLLIIASLDFSHYTAEETALINDKRMTEWFENLDVIYTNDDDFNKTKELAKNSDPSDENGIAVDSPETLYVFISLMRDSGLTKGQIWKRTSSASLTGISDPEQNTSHIFALFKKNQET